MSGPDIAPPTERDLMQVRIETLEAALEARPERPPSVQAALAAVIRELPAIGKDDSSPELGYRFRGIESLTAAVQPLLGKHGVIIVPQVRHREVVVSQASRHPAMQDVRLEVDWQIIGPDGSSFTATTHGIGRDHTDKGANKAQTQAFKYLLLHLLCISDAKDDADGRDPELEHGMAAADMVSAPDPVKVTWSRILSWAGTPNADALKAFAAEHGQKLVEKSLAQNASWHALMVERLDALDVAAEQDAAAEGGESDGEAAPVAQDEPGPDEGTVTPDEPETATEPPEAEEEGEGVICGDPDPSGVGLPCMLDEGHDGEHLYEEPF